MATSVSPAGTGVTYNFASSVQVGQYANGEWWAVGPVTITSITPAAAVVSGTFDTSGGTAYSNRNVNGTMVNPGNRSFVGGSTAANYDGVLTQGFDSLGTPGSAPTLPYNSSLDKDPATLGSSLVVTTGSVVKTISRTGANGTTYPDSSGRQHIQRMVVLTVVSSAPAAGSFRPPIAVSDKASYWTDSDLDYSWWPSLALPSGDVSPWASGTTVLTTQAAKMRGPYPLHFTQNTAGGRTTMPLNDGQAEYGREIGHDIAISALALCLDYTNAQKRDLLVGLVQLGIDVLGRRNEGGIFASSGGGEPWRKMPLLIAAKALASSAGAAALNAEVAASRLNYAESGQYFTVAKADIDANAAHYTADGRSRPPYDMTMVGTSEWGEAHTSTPSLATVRTRDGNGWETWYRPHNVAHMLGQTLAARLMGLDTLWNDPIVFDYEDRAWSKVKNSTFTTIAYGNSPTRFTQRMWQTYRNDSAATVPILVEVVGDGFVIGARFNVNLDVNFVPALGDFVPKVNGSTVTPPASFSTTLSAACVEGASTITVASATGIKLGMTLSGPVSSLADPCFVGTTRVKSIAGTTITLDSFVRENGASGQALTFSSLRVEGRAVQIVVPTALAKGDTVSLAYTQGATPLRNMRGVNVSSFSNTAGVNYTGQLIDPAPSISMIDNQVTARNKMVAGYGYDTGVKRLLLAVKFRVDTRTASAALLWASTNYRLYLASGTQIRMTWGGSTVFQHSMTPTPALSDGMTVTLLSRMDLTATSYSNQGIAYINDNRQADPTVGNITGGHSGINMAVGDVGLMGSPDGTSSPVLDGAFEWLWIDWGGATFTLPDITDSTVRAKFTTALIGGNGEGITGSAPKIFLPGYAPELNDVDGGLFNRGSVGGKAFSKLSGTWS